MEYSEAIKKHEVELYGHGRITVICAGRFKKKNHRGKMHMFDPNFVIKNPNCKHVCYMHLGKGSRKIALKY